MAFGLALVAMLIFALTSSRYSLQVHTTALLMPLVVLAMAMAAQVISAGKFVRGSTPLFDFFMQGPAPKFIGGAYFMMIYQIATILLCTESGPSRRALSRCQAWVNLVKHSLVHCILATQAALGSPTDSPVAIAVASAAHVAAPLLLLLLTPRAGPAVRRKGERQPSSAVAWPTDAQADADTRASAPASDPADAGTSTVARSRADTTTVAPGVPTASDSAELQFRSILLSRSVSFTAKFLSLHLADHPHLATPEGLAALRARVERKVSERASVHAGAPVSLRLVTLHVGAGCVVVHGNVIVDGSEDGEAEAEMLRAVMASELLDELTPEGTHVLDGGTAVLQLGDATAPIELAFIAAGGRFAEAPPRGAPRPASPPGVPLLSATCPLLALPSGGNGRVHLQFATALLTRALGHNPELVVSWAPSGASTAHTLLVRENVAALQAAARARGSPPDLIDIDIDLGPRPSHGMFIAQVVDGDALLAAHSVALLPASAAAAVAELLRARLPADTLRAVAHDLGVLLCGPRVRAAGDAALLRRVVLALVVAESASHPALPALRALLNGSLHELDAAEAELEASPSSSSSPSDAETDADRPRPPCVNRPPLLWCWACVIICAVRAAQSLMELSGAAATLSMLAALPHTLHILAASTRLPSLLPRVLRGVDSCAAERIYVSAVVVAHVATGIDPGPRAPEQFKFKYAGDIAMLLAVAWLETLRSPAVVAALSLLVEVPSACLFRWHALASCGHVLSAGQALTQIGMRVALLTAVHAAVWAARVRAVQQSTHKLKGA
ncbi:hypothetical protein FOA52_006063 [Chlamydomonas sp. UWO 241]|nr:hypothetical protein FOA52_006063 [Chlamydomonas sp. UWO 241]